MPPGIEPGKKKNSGVGHERKELNGRQLNGRQLMSWSMKRSDFPPRAADQQVAVCFSGRSTSRLCAFQMEAVVPSAPPPPWLPAVSTAFEALRYSTEMSRRLKVFCSFSKRLVRHLRRAANCPPRRR